MFHYLVIEVPVVKEFFYGGRIFNGGQWVHIIPDQNGQ